MQTSGRSLALAAFARRCRPLLARGAVSLPIPSTPSCSRWLTCSCCRANRSGSSTEFFSHNPHQPQPQPQPQLPVTLPDDAPRTKPPALPLPPRLPYSPTSLPFKRHLEALSRSLLGEPHDSWHVYLSLHADLRRYIPDNLFRDLIRHQLEDGVPLRRWDHARTLLRLARSCDMAYTSLGRGVVEAALKAGLEAAQIDAKTGHADRSMLLTLWQTMVQLHGKHLSAVDKDLRWAWMVYVRSHFDGRVRRKINLDPDDPLHPINTLETLVKYSAAYDVTNMIEALLRRCTGEAARRAVVVAARLRTDGASIKDQAFRRCLAAFGESGSVEARNALCAELEQCASPDVISDMLSLHSAAFDAAQAAARAPADKARSLLEQCPSLRGESVLIIAREILTEADAPTLEILLAVHQHLATRKGDWSELYDGLVFACDRLASPDTVPVVLALAEVPAPASLLASHVALLRLLGRHIDRDDIYTHARARYGLLRSTYPSHSWKKHPNDWSTLFRAALARRHTQFASRLYNDLVADTQPPRYDALAMISALGLARNASRPILLERHIRDYLAYYPAHVDELVVAVVDGLTRANASDDALLGHTIARRLLQEREIPEKSALALVECLARSPDERYRDAMLDILQHASNSPSLGRMYDLALASIVSGSTSHPELRRDAQHAPRMSSLVALDRCIELYHVMTSRGLSVSARTISTILVALVKADRLDTALQVFDATGERYTLKSGAVARLMVNLTVQGRVDDAERVEGAWREGVREGASGSRQARDVYDKGMVGARVLVDVARGREVDVDEVQKRTGWRATGPFVKFLDKVRERRRREREQEEASGERVAVAVAVADAVGEEQGPEARRLDAADDSGSTLRSMVRPGSGGRTSTEEGAVGQGVPAASRGSDEADGQSGPGESKHREQGEEGRRHGDTEVRLAAVG